MTSYEQVDIIVNLIILFLVASMWNSEPHSWSLFSVYYFHSIDFVSPSLVPRSDRNISYCFTQDATMGECQDEISISKRPTELRFRIAPLFIVSIVLATWLWKLQLQLKKIKIKTKQKPPQPDMLGMWWQKFENSFPFSAYDFLFLFVLLITHFFTSPSDKLYLFSFH